MKDNKTYKMEKNKINMKRVILSIFSILFLFIFINSVSAVQFWKYDGLKLDNNVSSYKWGVVTYDTFSQTSGLDVTPPWYAYLDFGLIPFNIFQMVTSYADYNTDTIESGKPLEVEILYNVYPSQWNTYNLNNTVSYCSFAIKYSPAMSNYTSTIYAKNFTSDLQNGKYFVKLQKGDTFYVDEQCFFNSPSQRVLTIPADFTIVTPTWNCQSCQYYKWLSDQTRVTKAETLQSYSTTILSYMKNIILIFYEFFIYGWWFLLIALLLFSISLIFIGIWWIYSFISRSIK